MLRRCIDRVYWKSVLIGCIKKVYSEGELQGYIGRMH